jgi:predicted HicB family RNase H-like nuclease
MKLEYKGYVGEFTYDEDIGLFEGSIANIKELVTFQGKSVTSLQSDFQDAVNDYIDWCKKRGKEPEKPFQLFSS